jgi:hypothetical protein
MCRVVAVLVALCSLAPWSLSTLSAQEGPDSVVIRLSQVEEAWESDPEDPMQLEVLEGKYRITSGTELWTGSSIRVSEDWMTFPAGLVIEIGTGGVTLKESDYVEGTRLRVDTEGNLAPITSA